MVSGVTKGLPSRSPPIHEPKVTKQRKISGGGRGSVLGRQRRLHLRVEHGQRAEERRLVVVERHANLVANGRPRAAYIVRLPQRRDLRQQIGLQLIEFARRHRDAVQLLQQVGDAASLEHDGPPRDLSRVRGEDRRDAYLAE